MTNHSLPDLQQPANAVLPFISQKKTVRNSQIGRVIRHNVVPLHRKPSPPKITTHISFSLSDIEDMPQFVQVLLTNIRPRFPEFTLHFSQRLGGLNINILPNNASEFSKQRLAMLDQALQMLGNGVKKKAVL